MFDPPFWSAINQQRTVKRIRFGVMVRAFGYSADTEFSVI